MLLDVLFIIYLYYKILFIYNNILFSLNHQAIEDVYTFTTRQLSAFTIALNNGQSLLRAMFNNQPFHVPPLILNIADLAIIRTITGNKDFNLQVINHPLPKQGTESVSKNKFFK